MKKPPSKTEGNGRGPNGRFLRGNKIAVGNPNAQRVARLKSRMLDCVTGEDVEAVVKKLVELAKSGDLAAIHELLDRLFGKAPASLDLAGDLSVNPPPSHEERQALLLSERGRQLMCEIATCLERPHGQE